MLTMDRRKSNIKSIISKFIYSIFYKRRYFFVYIIYGVISVSLELITREFLIYLNANNLFANYFSVLIGISLMFYLNANFNFNIPRYLYLRSFFYFLVIDILSISLEYYLNLNHLILLLDLQNSFFLKLDLYSYNRFIIFLTLFVIGYFLHLKIAFSGTCKVGLAIYANKDENLIKIYKSVENFPDFIHVDLVDQTMETFIGGPEISIFNKIKELWPNHLVETHIMSKKPSIWIDKVLDYSDIIYFDIDIDEDISFVKSKITSNNCEPGIILKVKNNYEKQIKLIEGFKNILLLTIDIPGKSGQLFNQNAYKYIEQINKLPFRNKFKLCIDGGINANLIKKIKSDKIISASDILTNNAPKKRILRLKTFSKYEK